MMSQKYYSSAILFLILILMFIKIPTTELSFPNNYFFCKVVKVIRSSEWVQGTWMFKCVVAGPVWLGLHKAATET